MHDIDGCIVEKVVDGEELRARCRYRKDMGILEGHFPSNPLIPGVYAVELCLQLLSDAGLPVTFPLHVTKAKLSRPIKPDMTFSAAVRYQRIDGAQIRASSVLSEESPEKRELARLRLEIG
jgi:3-hydroxymyristoyl/3-hydroxydecanoyl-(acyl carrier protein) dehydratase